MEIDTSKLLVTQLKTNLRKLGLSTTGTKPVLLERLNKYLFEQQQQQKKKITNKEEEEEEEESYDDDDDDESDKENDYKKNYKATLSNSSDDDDSSNDDDNQDDDVTSCFSKLTITKPSFFQPISQNIKEKENDDDDEEEEDEEEEEEIDESQQEKEENEENESKESEESEESEEYDKDIKYSHKDTCYEKIIPIDEKKENRCLELDSSTVLRLSSNLLDHTGTDNETTILTLPAKKMMAKVLKDLRHHTFSSVLKCAKQHVQQQVDDCSGKLKLVDDESIPSLLIDSTIIRDCARECYGNGDNLVSKIIQKWNSNPKWESYGSVLPTIASKSTLINRWSIVNHADNFFNNAKTSVNITYQAYLFMTIAIEIVMNSIYNDIIVNSSTKDIGLATLKKSLESTKYNHVFRHYDYSEFKDYAWNPTN
ncbi:hypothetical protein DFA_11728 [Cavenderia fasciculata]|uniref:SAP domain-containing protein n=1 Tax=Cavenderia fasciculata TaxID=261658 RepID=F4QE20_CACFS|nr:uncharacterized protein DFA_11728 [Cavenderia fasciculata]EGG13967.1 hypothetical protein DFA_11728 [Cavenderia fasciculata]|eukprot:XP_004350675.1 hypothetical protein DFA_11728 [Cavenderia fasciculata]